MQVTSVTQRPGTSPLVAGEGGSTRGKSRRRTNDLTQIQQTIQDYKNKIRQLQDQSKTLSKCEYAEKHLNMYIEDRLEKKSTKNTQ